MQTIFLFYKIEGTEKKVVKEIKFDDWYRLTPAIGDYLFDQDFVVSDVYTVVSIKTGQTKGRMIIEINVNKDEKASLDIIAEFNNGPENHWYRKTWDIRFISMENNQELCRWIDVPMNDAKSFFNNNRINLVIFEDYGAKKINGTICKKIYLLPKEGESVDIFMEKLTVSSI